MRLGRGLSFSPKRALGITGARLRLSRRLGFPTTRYGIQRRLGAQLTSGCLVLPAALILIVGVLLWATL